jgi:hypothetical protein
VCVYRPAGISTLCVHTDVDCNLLLPYWSMAGGGQTKCINRLFGVLSVLHLPTCTVYIHRCCCTLYIRTYFALFGPLYCLLWGNSDTVYTLLMYLSRICIHIASFSYILQQIWDSDSVMLYSITVIILPKCVHLGKLAYILQQYGDSAIISYLPI